MPTQERLRELFYFDAETGTLRRRKQNRRWPPHTPVGSIRSCDRYYETMVDGHKGLIHRFIWVWHHGAIPPSHYIDHIDHNRSNNRIENLRLVIFAENYRNLSISKANTSGYVGVSRHRNKWEAKLRAEGKTIHLGRFDTPQEAAAARHAANVIFGFHANHGKM